MMNVGIVAGSNIRPAENLLAGIDRLRTLLTDVRRSSIYAGPAAGPPGQPDFHNAVVVGRTNLGAGSLRMQLRRIEVSLGRVRSADRFAPRPLDLDIVFYGTLAIRTPEIEVPDPEALDVAHIAVPLAELVPDWRPPGGDVDAADAVKQLDHISLQCVD